MPTYISVSLKFVVPTLLGALGLGSLVLEIIELFTYDAWLIPLGFVLMGIPIGSIVYMYFRNKK